MELRSETRERESRALDIVIGSTPPRNNLSHEISNDWIYLWNGEYDSSNTRNCEAKIWFSELDKKKKKNEQADIKIHARQEKNIHTQ